MERRKQKPNTRKYKRMEESSSEDDNYRPKPILDSEFIYESKFRRHDDRHTIPYMPMDEDLDTDFIEADDELEIPYETKDVGVNTSPLLEESPRSKHQGSNPTIATLAPSKYIQAPGCSFWRPSSDGEAAPRSSVTSDAPGKMSLIPERSGWRAQPKDTGNTESRDVAETRHIIRSKRGSQLKTKLKPRGDGGFEPLYGLPPGHGYPPMLTPGRRPGFFRAVISEQSRAFARPPVSSMHPGFFTPPIRGRQPGILSARLSGPQPPGGASPPVRKAQPNTPPSPERGPQADTASPPVRGSPPIRGRKLSILSALFRRSKPGVVPPVTRPGGASPSGRGAQTNTAPSPERGPQPGTASPPVRGSPSIRRRILSALLCRSKPGSVPPATSVTRPGGASPSGRGAQTNTAPSPQRGPQRGTASPPVRGSPTIRELKSEVLYALLRGAQPDTVPAAGRRLQPGPAALPVRGLQPGTTPSPVRASDRSPASTSAKGLPTPCKCPACFGNRTARRNQRVSFGPRIIISNDGLGTSTGWPPASPNYRQQRDEMPSASEQKQQKSPMAPVRTNACNACNLAAACGACNIKCGSTAPNTSNFEYNYPRPILMAPDAAAAAVVENVKEEMPRNLKIESNVAKPRGIWNPAFSPNLYRPSSPEQQAQDMESTSSSADENELLLIKRKPKKAMIKRYQGWSDSQRDDREN